MDALTHAIEAYTATNANALSDASALHAIRLIAGNLAAAVAHGGDVEARSGMLLGSTLAGVAFSHSDVGSVHCLAEALGGIYDAPHGLCNAVILPAVMRYNMNHSKDRYAAIAAAMGESFASTDEGAEIAVRAVEALAREVSLPDFAGLGVREADFDTLAGTAAANGSNISNPRPMRKQDYVNLLEMLSRTR
jgi:alcohol dehydrogenase